MSNFLRPHGLQHARFPCPSPSPGVCSDSLSRWCHLMISSSVVPFSSCLQSFILLGSFPFSQFFLSGGQNIGGSASASVLPMNTQDWSLGWTGWISLQSKGLSRVFTFMVFSTFLPTELSTLSTWISPETVSWTLKKENKPVQFSSVAQSCPTLCNPMNHSMPGLSVHQQLPEITSTTPGVHSNSCPSSRWCHPTISSSVVPFSSCHNLSQHQGLFKWVSSSHQVARVLEFHLQHQSYQWTPRTDL